jgi:hypothetical protein
MLDQGEVAGCAVVPEAPGSIVCVGGSLFQDQGLRTARAEFSQANGKTQAGAATAENDNVVLRLHVFTLAGFFAEARVNQA